MFRDTQTEDPKPTFAHCAGGSKELDRVVKNKVAIAAEELSRRELTDESVGFEPGFRMIEGEAVFSHAKTRIGARSGSSSIISKNQNKNKHLRSQHNW